MKRKTCIRFLVFFQVTTTGTLKNNHCHRSTTTTAAAVQGKGKTKMCIFPRVVVFFFLRERWTFGISRGNVIAGEKCMDSVFFGKATSGLVGDGYGALVIKQGHLP